MQFKFVNTKINPNDTALISSKILKYKDFYDTIYLTIQNLKICNFSPGEPVAVLTDNHSSFLILFWALIHVNVITVPMNNKLPINNIKHMLNSINCNKIFTDPVKFENNFDSGYHVFNINEFISNNSSFNSDFTFKSLQFDQMCSILFTSGSTGNPKAVLHTIGNHYFNALGSNKNIPFGIGDKWLLSLPLYHVAGISILFRMLLGGGTVVIPDKDLSITENINKHDVSHISLVATQLKQMLEKQGSNNSIKNIKAILLGGGFIPTELIKISIKYNLPIHTTYGSTEMASQITTTERNENPEKLFTSGKLLEHRELKIADDGEILVKGQTLFKGYVTNNSLERPVDSEGWFHTNDLGEMDKEGFLSIIGRKDNMFISGGENIYPEEIEKCLMNIDGIENVVVINISDSLYGSRPIAYIKSNNYQTIKKHNLMKILQDHLPKFKIPDSFFKWPEYNQEMKPSRVVFKNYYLKNKSKKIS